MSRPLRADSARSGFANEVAEAGPKWPLDAVDSIGLGRDARASATSPGRANAGKDPRSFGALAVEIAVTSLCRTPRRNRVYDAGSIEHSADARMPRIGAFGATDDLADRR